MPPKNRDILRRLHEEGWYLDRQNGITDDFAIRSKRVPSRVAGHEGKTPPPGTWQNIKRQPGWKA